MKRLPRLLTVLALTAAVLAASCGDKSQEKAEHNEADVHFAEETIAGHQVSIETVNLALPRVNTPDVRRLAKEIRSAEEEALHHVEKLLKDWGVHHEGKHAALPEEERRELEHAEGTELDRVFLRTMIAHHEKAVETTKTVIAKGKSKEAKKLAHELLRAQERELKAMERVLVGV